jgi:hypothetical protein
MDQARVNEPSLLAVMAMLLYGGEFINLAARLMECS